jgi:adenylate cyclase
LERKLTAILCADVYGYSRLMGQNEEATLRTLSACRKIIDSLIERHHGRFVNSAGDSVLAEFASVVEAVTCAVSIQTALKDQNAQLPLERRMQFRIGVNSGDVMVEGEEIYGDGVNVAARLENLADPGGICISGTVYEQVSDRLALSYQDCGEQAVKNIARPVRVWRVLLDQAAPSREEMRRGTRRYWLGGMLSLAGIAIIAATFVLVQQLSLRQQSTHASTPAPPQPALSLPSIPSIAVLPFANLSGDPQQEYFSDGITADLITDLSRLHNLFVIARTSSFTYKGKPEKVQTIGRELGVKYLLEGSARKAGDQLRINVQLVDAATGNELWAQRYNRQMRDIFKLQDEIVQSLVTTLGLQFSMLEKGIVLPQRTNNLEAYDYYLRGVEEALLTNPTPDGFAKARKLVEKAAELDPGYADAYAMLGFFDLLPYAWQWDSDSGALERAAELANRAIALDDTNAGGYTIRGWVSAIEGKRNQAIADSQQAVYLEPNSAWAWFARADINGILGGQPEETLAYVQKARRLDPRQPEIGCLQEGAAYNMMFRYAEAVDALERCERSEQNNPNPWIHVHLVFAYSELGREREARAEAAEVLRASPRFSLEQVSQGSRGKNWQDPGAQHFLAVLRKAGLK